MLDLLHEMLSQGGSYFEQKEIAEKESGKSAIEEIQKKGFYIKRETDQKARPVFVGLQAVGERAGVDVLVTQNRALSHQVEAEKAMVELVASKKGKSVWIIHTPLIATPCVTDGQATQGLLAREIEKNETLKALTLLRASIIRDYLDQGGKLIIAYNSQEQPGRTPEQMAIYEKLKTKYAKQIVDFPMALGKDKYPEDFIGATYLMADPEGNWFEMTNRGVQANAPKEAEWGIWVQDSEKRVEAVDARMKLIFNFLVDQKMAEALEKAGVDKEAFSPLERYMSLALKSKNTKKAELTF